MTIKKRVLLLGTVAVLSLSTAISVQASEQRTAGSTSSDTYKQLNLFGDVFERVRAEYVEEVEDKVLIEHALNGMLSNLDPHSGYMNEEEFTNMRVQNKGEFGGLGIEVTMENGLVKVVSPIDDTPAARAGIQAGDLIVQINDEQVMGMTLSQAVKQMRGKVGTDIHLKVIREGADEPIDIKITRDIIQIKSVRWRIEGNVGYIRITTFNQQTTPGLEEAFANIKKELGDDLIGYVLDLRNNPGGLLEEAISVSDAFLEQGEIVSTRGRTKDDMRRDNATPGDMTGGLPVVALINGGSASASEIVAGALQDHKRGIILGTQSFGKGSVQTIMTLPGNGAIRLTTARYYTPSGRSIQGEGIEPDIIVHPAKVIVNDNSENEIHEADLRGALTNDSADESDSNEDKKGLSKEAKNDYQLTRAIDLLQGITLYKETVNKK